MERVLYVHVPYCKRKCLYCDFYSITDFTSQDIYIDALLKEIDRIEEIKLKSIFIGGGTPTVLSNFNLERLLKRLSKFSAAEFTIEANPGTVDIEKLLILKDNGVNRLSFGLQTVQDRLLERLGRIHSFEEFLKNFELARKIGFNNINVDLMFDIPGQTLEDWKETLKRITDLRPEHISCYSLIIEEGTQFYDLFEKGQLDIADEDIDRSMYHFAIDFLKEKGYEHYEISNFSYLGFECIHNLTYWNEEEYYGVGAAAHSFIDHYRYSNAADIKRYIQDVEKNIYEDKTFISTEEEMSEFMFLGLRKIQGVSKKVFTQRFNKDIINVYGNVLEELIKKELVIDDGKYIKLTTKGLDVANYVFEKFI
ncbi:Oxygen-independent coproporphyrinogen-III oxidase 1 [Caloramator mitchellensis]|uniref:Heme chaperone HemW n=1 Tax=Caloramator mitchellensis TaxID=908809 RepID=A0A0R3K1N2_CALMK|nr:Oxygen-independent coproporphyrinogen-III oxidase 1 [Caloramator mitchellensis]